MSDDAIGGYFELELPFIKNNIYPTAHKFQSARAAFYALILAGKPNKIWMPRYICDSMLAPLIQAGITYDFYSINEQFEIKDDINLSKDEWLLYVNYFGICTEQQKSILNKFNPNQVIFDHSQAFFVSAFDCLATVYSPRKFFGVPDGGLLYSNDPRIKQPEQSDDSSEYRMGHLISRLTKSPEAAYQQYIEAEQAISNLPVQGMSLLTERLLQSVDYQRARNIRVRNALYLHEHLGQYNQLNLKFDETVAPLCYPFIPNVKTTSKGELISQRVFIPTYWTEVLGRIEEGSFEWNLVTNGLFLPCDQRYKKDDMNRLISLLAIK